MKRKRLLQAYLDNRMTGAELARELEKDTSSEGKQVLRMASFDEWSRGLLGNFEAPAGAAERLAHIVEGTDVWSEQLGLQQKQNSAPSLLRKLSLQFEVVGHGLVDGKPQRKQSKARNPRRKPRNKQGKGRR